MFSFNCFFFVQGEYDYDEICLAEFLIEQDVLSSCERGRWKV